ncbi:hypothetical protein L7F22_039054 [Adiantum nelumboides]|nr:hypothetical protein [Adiantum nelumboides]
MPSKRAIPRKRTSDEASNESKSPTRISRNDGRTAASRRRVVKDSDSEEEEEDIEEQEVEDSDEEESDDDESGDVDDDGEEEEEGVDAEEEAEDVDEEEGEEDEEGENGGDSEEDKADETIIDRSLAVADSSDEEEEQQPEQPKRRARVVSAAEYRVKREEPDEQVSFDRESTPQASSSSTIGPQTPDKHRIAVKSATPTSNIPNMPRTPGPGGASVSFTPMSQSRTPAPQAPPAPPKTRLIIHKMVLRNFKSYAGEQIIGPFHKSFSAVVGPNGSGKSNVIDAMLFVFGWRANKMRQGKLSELIHNSAGQLNIGSCTVEVHFRDIYDLPGDDFKPVPNTKLVVARTAYRNNSSVYTMNGKKSSFTEVTTLLKERGIDLDHKRFLILQGEVESIAQMPPKAKNEHEEGLLEYLEDIIGTSSYKTPIEEASKKVDELNEVRGERLARLKIVQKEKDSLEGKKQEAEGFLRDQNELTMRQSTLYQIYMMECNDEMKIATISVEKLRKRIEEETEKNAGSKTEMDQLDVEFKAINAEYEKIAKETDKVVKELAKLEKDDVQLKEQRKHLETKKKKIEKTMNDEKHATSEARSTLANSSEEISNLAKEVAKLEDSLEKEEGELEKVREGLKGKTQAFSDAIEKKQKELQPWTAKRSEKQNAKQVATEEKRLLEDRFGQAEKEAEDAKISLQTVESSNESKEEELERLKEEKVQQGKKIRQYQAEIDGMEAQEVQLRNKASSSRTKCEEARASMQSNQSRGEVLNSLVRQADLGMIKGFHGRLGNLGVIDEKYDVAISTACPGLDNIVVEGVETGQACIEHLRRNNLGRANFILLNSLAKMNLGPINTPENVPRLFDLVKPKDQRFAPAFYHQLRDTLVAQDLAHANRIAYGAQRWRVVTLDGQLIDKSGTMSGGGTRVAKGAMSSKAFAQDYTLEQISRLDRESKLDQDSLASHIKHKNDMKALLDKAMQRIPQIDIEMEKVQLDISTGAKMATEAKRRIKELQSNHGPDAGDLRRVEELNATISKLDSELAELTVKTSSIEEDIAALQEKILEAGGVALRAQKSKVDGIKERIDLYGERITKAEVAKSKADKDLVKFAKSLAKNEEALSGIEDELNNVLDTLTNKGSKVDEIRKRVQECQFEMEAKQEAKDETKSKYDTCMESINTFRALEMEIRQKLEDNEKSLGDNEKRLRHWQEKHEKLELHHIDSDEDVEGEADRKSAAERKPEVDQENMDEGQDGSKTEGIETVDKGVDSHDITRSLELQEYSPDELKGMSKDTIKAEIVVYEEKLQKGSANLTVLEEYRRRENEFLARAQDLEQTTQERDQAKEQHDRLRQERQDNFLAGFNTISAKLKEMYQTITLGGNAELELVDSMDPFSEGILFSVMPPKKSWKNISNLSGGEKTLSSLALVFALHAFEPTPLYAMDELDAALDFRNVSIVANLIKERTKGAQFIVISLRNNMFELASRLVGIYKTKGQTKSLAVHNTDLHALPAATPGIGRLSVPRPSVPPMPSSAATPRMSVPRSITATPGPSGMLSAMNQSQSMRMLPPPSTIRKPMAGVNSAFMSSSNLATPAANRFSAVIPQTPRTGNIRGLGLTSTGSSIKLTSSHSMRGNLSNLAALGTNSSATIGQNGNEGVIPSTPLANRRMN